MVGMRSRGVALLQHETLANVAVGSFATEMGFRLHVRFTPDSDRTADIAGGPFGADFVAKVG
jgi:hypothetical protein